MKQAYIKAVLLVGIFLFILTGCSRLNPSQPGSGSGGGSEWLAYYPHKEGDTWDFQVKVADNVKLDLTFKVAGHEKVNGVDCIIMEGRANGQLVQKEFLEVSDKGVIAHKREMHGGKLIISLSPPEPMYKFPLEKNKKWTWKGKLNDKLEGDFEFAVLDEEEVEVPAGKFKAFKVEMKGSASDKSSVQVIRWIAKDVGVVKEESSPGGMQFTAVLKSYTIDGKTYGETPKMEDLTPGKVKNIEGQGTPAPSPVPARSEK